MNENILLAYFAANAKEEDLLEHQECDVRVGMCIPSENDDKSLKYLWPIYDYDKFPETRRVSWKEYCLHSSSKYKIADDPKMFSREELKMKYALSMIWKLREFQKLLDSSET